METKYITVKIALDEYAIKEKSLHEKGFSDHLADTYTEANAAFICKAVNTYEKLVEALEKAHDLIYKAYMKSFNSHLGETAKAFNERWEAFNVDNGTSEIRELLNSLKD